MIKYLKYIVWVGTGLGAIGGYLYWEKIGCITGTCPLKSQWQTMVPIGAYFGFTIGSIVKGLVGADKDNENDNFKIN